jgi:hypothetical protein
MFSDAVTASPRKTLYVVEGGRRERNGNLQGAATMNTYKFAAYPDNALVASAVTVLVSAWFLVAAGAILTDPVSPYTQRPQAQVQVARAAKEAAVPRVIAAAYAVVPDAHFTITVEASRRLTTL